MSEFAEEYLESKPQSTLMIKYLLFLRRAKFNPKVVYDIGSYNGTWSNLVREIFPEARVIMIDASLQHVDKYTDKEYYIECLSNEVKEVDFYELKLDDRLKSYYKPKHITDETPLKIQTNTLSKLIEDKGLPYPDLVRIDCCGCEKDIIIGGCSAIQKAKYLFTTLQNEELFVNGHLAGEVGPFIKSLDFELKNVLDMYNTPLIDYVFENKNI
jgi:FkbM family methyltransferase